MNTTSTGKVLGWKRPSGRHHLLRAANHLGDGFGATPQSKGFKVDDEVTDDRCSKFFTVLDQGQVGDCTANGGVECMLAALKIYGLLALSVVSNYFSRYFLYAVTRILMGVPLTEDSGATITDMVMTLVTRGVCLETSWPSVGDKWQDMPTQAAYTEASQHTALRWYALSSVEWIKACITMGFPVVFGVTLFDSFENVGADGYVPMPVPGENEIGGHCMIIVGYRKRADGGIDFKVLNSWGEGWGDGGFGWMPQEYWDSTLATESSTIHQEKAAA